MPEILTESFCERCGTRYTFESARPKVRLKGVKVLSRGLKNFVLSDDTTMDEAMAAARSEADRESTAHQLDAFHKTFNFCMSCRQYTCPNCWNEVDARCQSCAPLPEREITAPAVIAPEFPGLVSLAGPAGLAEPASNAANGQDHGHPPAPAPALASEPAAKAADQTAGLLSRFRPGQNLDDELAAFEREQGQVPEAAATETAITEPALPEAGAAAEPASLVEANAVVETEAPAAVEAVVETEPAAAAEAVVETEPAAAVEAGGPAAAEAAPEAQTAFEAEGAAEAEVSFEAQPAPEAETAAQAATTVAADSAPVAQEDLAAAAPLEPAAVAPEVTEPIGVESVVAAAAIQPEPIEATPAAEAEPGTTPADVVAQPTWRITAPDLDTPTTGAPARPGEPTPTQPTVTSPEPQWPTRPEWPTPQASAGLPFLGRPAQPQGGVESLWAASNRELVTTPPPPGRTTSGIQPCISCGLSLSANARFCRRCGTLQGGG